MKLPVYAAAGNVFALVDARTLPASEDPGALAVRLGARPAAFAGGPRIDGVIVLEAPAPADAADARVAFFNADGSRPEACGNGLRCAALHVVASGGGDRLRLATDAGLRRAQVLRDDLGRAWAARVTMGRPTEPEHIALALGAREVSLVTVSVGNPHAVLFTDDVARAPVATLGPAIAVHERFPGGTNVEFAHPIPGGLAVRVWERGVGETAACGTGACAVAIAARARGLADLPARIALSGGELHVDAEGPELALTGPCERIGVTG